MRAMLGNVRPLVALVLMSWLVVFARRFVLTAIRAPLPCASRKLAKLLSGGGQRPRYQYKASECEQQRSGAAIHQAIRQQGAAHRAGGEADSGGPVLLQQLERLPLNLPCSLQRRDFAGRFVDLELVVNRANTAHPADCLNQGLDLASQNWA